MNSAAVFWLLYLSAQSSAEALLACNIHCFDSNQSVASLTRCSLVCLLNETDAISTRTEDFQNSMVRRHGMCRGFCWPYGKGAFQLCFLKTSYHLVEHWNSQMKKYSWNLKFLESEVGHQQNSKIGTFYHLPPKNTDCDTTNRWQCLCVPWKSSREVPAHHQSRDQFKIDTLRNSFLLLLRSHLFHSGRAQHQKRPSQPATSTFGKFGPCEWTPCFSAVKNA